MSENIDKTSKSKSSTLLWVIISLIITVTIIVDRYFSNAAWGLRLIVWVVVCAILIPVAMKTKQGQRFWHFLKEARSEMRKVSWPTRPETTKTTLLIAGMVLITAIVMWGIDSILLFFIGWLTGQR